MFLLMVDSHQTVTDLSTNDIQGQLTYSLSCSPPKQDCGLLNTFINTINAAAGAIAPELAPLFAVGQAAITAEENGAC